MSTEAAAYLAILILSVLTPGAAYGEEAPQEAEKPTPVIQSAFAEEIEKDGKHYLELTLHVKSESPITNMDVKLDAKAGNDVEHILYLYTDADSKPDTKSGYHVVKFRHNLTEWSQTGDYTFSHLLVKDKNQQTSEEYEPNIEGGDPLTVHHVAQKESHKPTLQSMKGVLDRHSDAQQQAKMSFKIEVESDAPPAGIKFSITNSNVRSTTNINSQNDTGLENWVKSGDGKWTLSTTQTVGGFGSTVESNRGFVDYQISDVQVSNQAGKVSNIYTGFEVPSEIDVSKKVQETELTVCRSVIAHKSPSLYQPDLVDLASQYYYLYTSFNHSEPRRRPEVMLYLMRTTGDLMVWRNLMESSIAVHSPFPRSPQLGAGIMRYLLSDRLAKEHDEVMKTARTNEEVIPYDIANHVKQTLVAQPDAVWQLFALYATNRVPLAKPVVEEILRAKGFPTSDSVDFTEEKALKSIVDLSDDEQDVREKALRDLYGLPFAPDKTKKAVISALKDRKKSGDSDFNKEANIILSLVEPGDPDADVMEYCQDLVKKANVEAAESIKGRVENAVRRFFEGPEKATGGLQEKSTKTVPAERSAPTEGQKSPAGTPRTGD